MGQNMWQSYSENEDRILLEEYAPFSSSFYETLTLLLCQAIAPPNVFRATRSSVTSSVTSNNDINSKDSSPSSLKNPIEDLLTRHDMRGIRILLALLNLPTHIFSFQSLLHPRALSSNSNDANGELTNNMNKTSISPLIVSLMKHIAYLPDLEMIIRSKQRTITQQPFQTPNATSPSSSSSEVSSPVVVSTSNSFTVTTPSSSSSTSISTSISTLTAQNRQEHMQNMNALSTQLENKLLEHVRSLEHVLGYFYSFSDVNNRIYIKTKIGGILHSFSLTYHQKRGIISTGARGLGVENTNACGINMMLWVLYRIVRGFPSIQHKGADPNQVKYNRNANPAYTHLLEKILLPLHKPHEMILWRDQTPMLSLYHEPLVLCIVEICQQMTISSSALKINNEENKIDPNAIYDLSLLSNIDRVVQGLLDPSIWPIESHGNNQSSKNSSVINTPKVVLILHEIDTILEKLIGSFTPTRYRNAMNIKSETFQINFFTRFVTRLCVCIQGDNSRTSERALEFFKSKSFELLLKEPPHLESCMKPLMRSLCRVDRNMEKAWNPTVNKMTKLVLRKLEEWDEDLFVRVANTLLHKEKRQTHERIIKQTAAIAVTKKSTPIGVQRSTLPSLQKSSYPMTSLKNSMGDWKPPPTVNSSLRHSRKNNSTSSMPPLTVTGVAPWAMSPSVKNNNPPSTITGVAPFRNKNALPQNIRPLKKQVLSTSSSKSPFSPTPLSSTSLSNETSMNEKSVLASNDHNELTDRGIMLVRDYMKKLTPESSDDENSDGTISSWAQTQTLESPVLMPNLKFHDLVFRHDELGSGAFSTVKYARLILKNKTRSYWPEYAVKVVSTSKIEELGYSFSINREISILSLMSHPNIARLISSFRFRDGAYLVLEYASKGDLHSILQRDGSLDHSSAQFVVGEIVAALHSIHELGFVYADLKPENVLLTEAGHIKITDFGGCRAFTPDAKARLRKMKHFWKEMRDGDWREKQSSAVHVKDSYFMGEKQSKSDPNEDYEEEDDLRIEGTTAYLPPEVALGSIPTPAADVWALGCVLFQCLAGRPPILEDSEAETMQKIVTFHADQQPNDSFFEDKDESIFQTDTRDLITKLLCRASIDRPNMEAIARHSFFAGIHDVFTLYRHPAPRLNVGKINPSPNAKWARRQFSSIWAPQPKAYGYEHDDSNLKNEDGSANGGIEALRKIPIVEGEESKSFFLSERHMNPKKINFELGRITEINQSVKAPSMVINEEDED